MDIGYSFILSDFVEPSKLEPQDCKRLEVVCPECKEPVSKVLSRGVHFFVHASRKNPCYAALAITKQQNFFGQKETRNPFFKHIKKRFMSALSDRQRSEFFSLLRNLRHQRFASEWLLLKDFAEQDVVFAEAFFEKTIFGVARKRRIALRVYEEIIKSNGLWYFFGVLSILNYYNILADQLQRGIELPDAQAKLKVVQDIASNSSSMDSESYHAFLLNLYQTMLFRLSQIDFRQVVMDVNRNKKKSDFAGYVYILHNPEHQSRKFKVGRTQVSVRERAKALSSTSMLCDFEVVDEWYTVDCYRSEKAIHQALAYCRIREDREFFETDLDTIRMAIEQNLVD